MRSSSNVVIAINGFLGLPNDWQNLATSLPEGWRLQAVNLWEPLALANFDEWARQTAIDLQKSLPRDGRKIILGYSLGGRLALHLLLNAPKFFDGAVIVSANPGLSSEDEKSKRIVADEKWAERFLSEPWNDVLHAWNDQPTLRPPRDLAGDAITLERREREIPRVTLAQALRVWSLGRQRDLRTEIDQITMPIEIVTGQNDEKFTAIAAEWAKRPAKGERHHHVIANAGHRVPWDAPSQFAGVLAKFLMRW